MKRIIAAVAAATGVMAGLGAASGFAATVHAAGPGCVHEKFWGRPVQLPNNEVQHLVACNISTTLAGPNQTQKRYSLRFITALIVAEGFAGSSPYTHGTFKADAYGEWQDGRWIRDVRVAYRHGRTVYYHYTLRQIHSNERVTFLLPFLTTPGVPAPKANLTRAAA